MRGIRIGRVFGIDVRIAWSWIVIFALLTWNLVAVFSQWHADWPPLESFGVALSASLVFFCCVLVHELAHCVVALGYGVPVRSITLFLFGGVSNIEHDPPSPTAEFLMAIVGPITSIGLGMTFLVVASVLGTISVSTPRSALDLVAQLGPFETLLVWLGPINILIGVFNLIPGFPLDGGRVLRSILWGITGDGRRATQVAAFAGQAIGWLFIALGIAMSFGLRVPFFGTGLGSGLWLAFIGWFLHSAAAQTTMRVALDDALAGMTVDQLMQHHGGVATPDLSVATLVHERLLPGDDRALPVVDDAGTLLGLVSIANVRDVPVERWPSTTAADIMRPQSHLTVTTARESLSKAFEQLAARDVDQLPVVDHGKLVGMLRRRDIMRWLELAWHPVTSRPHQDLRHRHA
jgi:Zn-dependent protease